MWLPRCFVLPCLLRVLPCATVLLSFATILLAQTCSRLSTDPDGVVDNGLYRHEVSNLVTFSLVRCVLECILVSACASLTYRNGNGICQLSNVTGEDPESWYSETQVRTIFYHDIRNWNWEVAGSCASRPCAENQRCISTKPYMCVDIDCGPPPIEIVEMPPYTFHVTGRSVSTSLGSKAQYTCGGAGTPPAQAAPVYESRVMFNHHLTYKICNSDFTWTNKNYDCLMLGLQDCEGVKACDPSYPDGHYLVYQSGMYKRKLKVYCHDMANNPKTYITVPSADNVAYNAGDGITDPTMTTFSKIRVNKDLDVDRSDFTFATTIGPLGNIPYGEAGSCHGDANKSAYGYFRINTAGTGVAIVFNPMKDDTNSWFTTGMSEVVDLLVSDGTNISSQCRGPCGRCVPHSLRLTWNKFDHVRVDGSDTVQPICV